MRIAVFGAGAVGGYFGGRLAEAGEDVTFIARGKHLEAIRERGLVVGSTLGDFTIHPARATEDPADIGAVDAVLVVDDTDGGGKHAELARPFIEAGMPVFIDKPMTTELVDAVALFDLAEQHNAPLMSCSALRFTVELAAIRDQVDALGKLSSIVSVGPEEWFYYGVHAVELVGALTNDRPRMVHRYALDKEDVAVITYDSDLVVVVETLRDAGYLFSCSVYGENGHLSFDVNDGMGFYTNTMRAFTEMIETRVPPVTREQTLNVLSILHAGNRSAETGGPVAIDEILEPAR